MAISGTAQQEALKEKIKLVHGLRFEVFYALQNLTDPAARIHSGWKERVHQTMPAAFYTDFKTLGQAPVIWALIADALETLPEPTADFDAVLSHLESLDPEDFRRAILFGSLHIEEIVEAIMNGKADLEAALARAPEDKLHWYTYLGIYPYDPEAPVVAGFNRLINDPQNFKETAQRLLSVFWEKAFRQTWTQIEPLLQQSLRQKKRIFASSSVSEFMHQALMRLEVDEEERVIKAIRGGCRLPFDGIRALYIMPSLFNDQRIWTTYYQNGGTVSYIPYFEPSYAIEGATAHAVNGNANGNSLPQPRPEPTLIFKALGDSTRFAIAGLIGQKPRTSAELAKILKVSKATISHHVQLLREAGLLNEDYAGGAVKLSLKREVIEQLSGVALKQFFGE